MDPLSYVAAAGAAFAGGVMNSIVGGGTLVTFPALLAIGVPPVAANVTNTVALCPGYFSGAMAQRSQLDGQRARLRRLAVTAALGGLVGAGLLLVTSDDALRKLVPALLGLATVLLGASNRIKRALGRGVADDAELNDAAWLPFVLALAAVYGGFFGAGVGVMLLAVLGIGVHQSLPRSNALKQVLSLVINLSAALYFVGSSLLGDDSKLWWGLAAVMSIGSIAGGHLGGRIVGRLDSDKFRWIVVIAGTALTIVYAVRVYF
jgi:uncharacterized protein